MTELDLAVELDMCGQEVIVVVATCKSTMKCDRTRRGKTWSDIDSERHVQWCNLGNSPEAGVVQSQKDDELEIYGMNRISDVLQHSNLPDTESITSGSVDNTTIDEDEQVSNAANIVHDDHIHSKNNNYDNCTSPQSHINDDTSKTHEESNSALASEQDVNYTSTSLQDKQELRSEEVVFEPSNDHHFNSNLRNDTQDKDICHIKPLSQIVDNEEQSPSKETITSASGSSDDDKTCPEWEEDENPWLGCICGETHEKPISVFWIQCDSCDAWYNCAPHCIGFSKHEAQLRDKWQCPDCSSTVEDEVSTNLESTEVAIHNCSVEMTPKGENKAGTSTINTDKSTVSSVDKEVQIHNCIVDMTPIGENNRIVDMTPIGENNLDGGGGTTSIIEKPPLLRAGTIVEVADRTWVGSNKPGGIAKIIDVHIEPNEEDDNLDDEVFYDVQYILESRKEYDVESDFISINQNVLPGFSSPAGSTRSTRGGSRRSRKHV